MSGAMKTRAAIAISLLFAAAPVPAREIDLEKPTSKLRRFASDAIFVVEAGDREKYSKRLPESVVVEFFGEAAPRPVAEKHLAEFFQVTGVRKVDTPETGPDTAKIGFYFGPQADLVKTAKDLERKIIMDRGYTYWIWWDGERTITRAVVLVATDRLNGAALEDRLIEQLLGVFGLPARSNEIEESCLSADERVLTSLQPVDKALLSFYYRAVPAGTRPRDFDKIFREEWSGKK